MKNKNKTKVYVTIDFKKDKDVKEFIEKQTNKSKLIKDLVRNDIEKNKLEEKATNESRTEH